MTLGRRLTSKTARTPSGAGSPTAPRSRRERIAIDDRGVTIDYATLAARATELAEALRAAGYGPGDRIATVSGNSTDHVVAFFACALAGIAFVPLSWRLTPRELADVLRALRPRAGARRGRARRARRRGAARARRRAAGRAARHDRGRGVRAAVARDPRAARGTCATTTRCSSSSPRGARRRRRASCSPTRTASGTTSRSRRRCRSPPGRRRARRCCRSSTSPAGTASRCSPGGSARRSCSSARSSRRACCS